MTRVLGIVGSPRKNGNTHILVSHILAGAREVGVEVEMLFLGDLEIRECDGCHACWKGERCGKNDDMIGVYPKIIQSDAIVFGTPVYWYGPTALMKSLIDRFVYFNCPENRSKIRGKRVAVASPFEEENVEAGALLVEFFKRCFEYLEMDLAGTILVPGVGDKGDILAKQEELQNARELGRRLTRREMS